MNKELLRELGQMAKRRREEIGLNRATLAKEAHIESEDAITAFEFGRSLPPADTRRKLERALSWRLEIIDEVMQRVDHPVGTLVMEELDAEDSLYLKSQIPFRTLTSVSDDELRAEVVRRSL